MYARSIKINFKDKMSKDMFVNFTDNKADAQGIKNGTLLKFIFENSDTSATLVLLFPDYKTFKKDLGYFHKPIFSLTISFIVSSISFKFSVLFCSDLSIIKAFDFTSPS